MIICQNRFDKCIRSCYTDTMEAESTPETAITTLQKAGLTNSQAKGYLALIEHGSLSPTKLANLTNESRTNGYMICEKLEKLGLATKDNGKKTLYSPTHPSALETLAERRRKIVERDEQIIKSNIGRLIDYYYTKRDTPGITTEVGRNAIESVYDTILRDCQPLEYLRSPHDSGYMSHEYYRKYALERAAAGVDTRVIAIETPSAIERWSPHYDTERRIVERTWITQKQYNAKVEWSVYGNKVSALTFGEEPVALTIHSRDIAESFHEIFALIRSSGHLASNDR